MAEVKSGSAPAPAEESVVDMRELAETFKALSDETRLQMVTLLLDHQELCVCDFVEALGLTQSKASRHLRYLYHSGLVRDRREGLWIHYRVAPELAPGQAVMMKALAEAVSPQQKERLRERLEAWFALKDERRSCAPGAGGASGLGCC